MKKILGIVVLGLLLSGNAYADLNGYGEVKLNQYNVNEFEHYLSDGIHGSKSTQKKYGTGLVFAITLDGTVSEVTRIVRKIYSQHLSRMFN